MNLHTLMTALEACGAICSIIILVCILIIRHSITGKQQFNLLFLMLFAVNALMLTADALARSYDGVSGEFAGHMVRTMNLTEYLSNQALQVLFTMYMADNFRSFVKVRGWQAIAWSVSLIFLVMMVLNSATGMIYYIDDANRYTHGTYYYFYLLPAMILQLSNIWMIMKYRKRLPVMMQIIGLLIAWVPVAAVIPQILWPEIPFLRLSCFGLAVMIFFNVQNMFAELLQEQNRKQVRAEERMLVAQLQPHFLYNALLAIMGIDGNPQETVDAISYFSKYLRCSLNSLRQEDTIPAAQELKHVEAYVKLEQLRYDGRLQINMDIREIDFYLPPLSLEMLVENAIRHGFEGMDEPGTVSVTSKTLDDWYMVTVEDNGCGFDVDAILNAPGNHVGLQSVKHRIEEMCGGELIIHSTKGVGTRASIMIPRHEVKDLKRRRVLGHHVASEKRNVKGKNKTKGKKERIGKRGN